MANGKLDITVHSIEVINSDTGAAAARSHGVRFIIGEQKQRTNYGGDNEDNDVEQTLSLCVHFLLSGQSIR